MKQVPRGFLAEQQSQYLYSQSNYEVIKKIDQLV